MMHSETRSLKALPVQRICHLRSAGKRLHSTLRPKLSKLGDEICSNFGLVEFGVAWGLSRQHTSSQTGGLLGL
jgi:hypothetical protein